MSRKNTLTPVRIASSQSLAASFNSDPTIIDFQDNIGYQINVTTSNSTGTFSIQGSLDYAPAGLPGPANAGNWVDLGLGGGTPTVAAANDSLIFKLDMVPFHAIRVAYTSTIAGTGTCDIYIMSKQV